MSISIYTFEGREIARIIDENGNVVARYPITEGALIDAAMNDGDWEF